MSNSSSFKEKYGPWALVTGASSGIGQQLAVQLAQRQLNVLLVGRNAPELANTAAQVRRHGAQAEVILADFEQPNTVQDVIRATEKYDVGLCIPAAGFGDSGLFVDADLTIQQAMLQVNVNAVMTLTHHFANRMKQRGRGGIILLASMLGFHGAPFSANYAATKAYVLSLGEALAIELKPAGVHLLVSSPGPTATGFAKRASMNMGKMMTAQEVATETLQALGNASTLLPGGLTKFLRGSLSTLPRYFQIRIIGNIMKGFARKS
jgi:short-subunit dehydrogenase